MPTPCLFCIQTADLWIRVKKKGEETFSPARPVCSTCFSRISADPRYDVEEVRQPAPRPSPSQTKRKKAVSLSVPVFCLILAAVIALSSASTAFVMKRTLPKATTKINVPKGNEESTSGKAAIPTEKLNTADTSDSSEPTESNESVAYDPRYDECLETIRTILKTMPDCETECIFNPDEMNLYISINSYPEPDQSGERSLDNTDPRIIETLKTSFEITCTEFKDMFFQKGLIAPYLKVDCLFSGTLLYTFSDLILTYDYFAEQDRLRAESTPAARENCHFRTARWGDDIETVKLYETERLSEMDGNLYIESVTVAGEKARVGMFFDPGYGLCQATYLFYEECRYKDGYLSRYNSLKNALTERYGEPAEDHLISLDETITYTESERLYFGKSMYFAVWSDGETEIMLSAQANQTKQIVDVGISYSCIDHPLPVNTGGL